MTFHDRGGSFYGSREEEINLEYVRVKIARLTQPLLHLYTIYQISREVADETRTSGCTTCHLSPEMRLNCKVFSRDKDETARRSKKNRSIIVGGVGFRSGPCLSLRFHPASWPSIRRGIARTGVGSGMCFVFAEWRSLYGCRAGYYICMYVRYYDTPTR